jgi:hypothetical protein
MGSDSSVTVMGDHVIGSLSSLSKGSPTPNCSDLFMLRISDGFRAEEHGSFTPSTRKLLLLISKMLRFFEESVCSERGETKKFTTKMRSHFPPQNADSL